MKKKPALFGVGLLIILVALIFVVYHFRSTSRQPTSKKAPMGQHPTRAAGPKSTPSSESKMKLSDEELEQLFSEAIQQIPVEDDTKKEEDMTFVETEPETQTSGSVKENSDIEIKRRRLEELRLSYDKNWQVVVEIIETGNSLREEHDRLVAQRSALIDEKNENKDDEERWWALDAESEVLSRKQGEIVNELTKHRAERERIMPELVNKLKEIKREIASLEEEIKSEEH